MVYPGVSSLRFPQYDTPNSTAFPSPFGAPFPFSPHITCKAQTLIGVGDTVTSPTASMLAATQNCTLQDDVFQEDPTTNSLEAYIADMTGKEAGLFIISGTMGNQLSIRTALGGPPHSVLADARSHVYGW